jgi:hypothetical protein
MCAGLLNVRDDNMCAVSRHVPRHRATAARATGARDDHDFACKGHAGLQVEFRCCHWSVWVAFQMSRARRPDDRTDSVGRVGSIVSLQRSGRKRGQFWLHNVPGKRDDYSPSLVGNRRACHPGCSFDIRRASQTNSGSAD